MPGPNQLRVPLRHRHGLTELATMPTVDAEALATRLESAPAVRRRGELAELLESNSVTSPRELADALISLSALVTSHDWSPREVAESLDLLSELADDDGAARLVASLSRLLETMNVSRLGKVYDLGSSYERTSHVARVITDMRPVFDVGELHEPSGFLVNHQLEFQHFANGRIESFYLAMSDDDLAKLARQVARAQEKSQALRSTLDKAGLSVFVSEPEDDL